MWLQHIVRNHFGYVTIKICQICRDKNTHKLGQVLVLSYVLPLDTQTHGTLLSSGLPLAVPHGM